ncbi:MAG: hypothetical protein Q9227_001327 [Pyrenula ochraceoflavens]
MLKPGLKEFSAAYPIHRIRKVKCDENRPSCLKCSSTGRTCDGYGLTVPSLPTRRSKPGGSEILGNLSGRNISTLKADATELRAFDFFVRGAAPLISGSLDDSFWFGPVLQLSRKEPVIWDAVIALSCLCEYPWLSNLPAIEATTGKKPMSDHNLRAMKWYSRAMHRLQKDFSSRPPDFNVVLLSCILFIAIEFFQNNYTAALTLYGTGGKLLNSRPESANGSLVSSLVDETMPPMFTRMGTFGTISGRHHPGELQWQSNAMVNGVTHPLTAIRIRLHNVLSEIHPFIVKATTTRLSPHLGASEYAVLRATQERLMGEMLSWHSELINSGFHPDHGASGEDAEISSLLLMYYASAFAWIGTCLERTESAWDKYHYLFKSLVRYADLGLRAVKEPVLIGPANTFDDGVLGPLHLAGNKCRIRKVRRRVVELLHRPPFSEIKDKHIPVPSIIRKAIEIEEENLPPYTGSSDTDNLLPPEEDRINDMVLMLEQQKDREGPPRIKLRYKVVKHSPNTTVTFLDGLGDWTPDEWTWERYPSP